MEVVLQRIDEFQAIQTKINQTLEALKEGGVEDFENEKEYEEFKWAVEAHAEFEYRSDSEFCVLCFEHLFTDTPSSSNFAMCCRCNSYYCLDCALENSSTIYPPLKSSKPRHVEHVIQQDNFADFEIVPWGCFFCQKERLIVQDVFGGCCPFGLHDMLPIISEFLYSKKPSNYTG